jgi:hypothetical protein
MSPFWTAQAMSWGLIVVSVAALIIFIVLPFPPKVYRMECTVISQALTQGLGDQMHMICTATRTKERAR